MKDIKLEELSSESRNEISETMDHMDIFQMLQAINNEDKKVALEIEKNLKSIELVIKDCVKTLKGGGKIFYVGAGTSGRIGIIDAVECLPTFSSETDFIPIIAGGDRAFIRAVEGAEDDEKLAINDLKQKNISPIDMVIGIAASGRTPYVISAVKYANELGCKTASIVNNNNTKLEEVAQKKIVIKTGPEILTGSTRMKAGTAEKMVCNMISTVTMKEMGKTYKNLMVDMIPTNNKLIERSKLIVQQATGCSGDLATKTLKETKYYTKPAIVMILCNCDKDTAFKLLKENEGFVYKIMESSKIS